MLQLALTRRKGYLPVKFLEYLGTDRPIILLSNEQDEMEEALTTTRTGAILRNSPALIEHLAEHLRVHEAGRAWPFNPDAVALASFDYRKNMHRWADLLEAALRRKAAQDRARPTSGR